MKLAICFLLPNLSVSLGVFLLLPQRVVSKRASICAQSNSHTILTLFPRQAVADIPVLTEKIIKNTAGDSLLRQFAFHSTFQEMNTTRFKIWAFEEKEDHYCVIRDGQGVMTIDKELVSEIWMKGKPWDNGFRDYYMVTEGSIEKYWEHLILKKRSYLMIKKAAEKGCVHSIIELAHLRRQGINDGFAKLCEVMLKSSED